MTRKLAIALCVFLLIFPAGASEADSTIRPALEHQIESVARDTLSARAQAELLERFYTLHDFALVWDKPEHLEHLMSALASLENDGLNPNHYGLQTLLAYQEQEQLSPDERVCRDVLASHAYLQALIHLIRGKTDPEALQPLWRFGDARRAPSPEMIVLHHAGSVNNAEEAFARARPETFDYPALRQTFAQLRRVGADPQAPAPVPAGSLLREGDRGERVLALRKRLAYADHKARSDPENETFDTELAKAVRQFQQARGLKQDGIVGPATLEQLNMGHAERLDKLRVNLERRRWLAHEARSKMLLVDIAGQEIHYLRDGNSVWHTRSQVGRATRPTPALRSEITHFTFNPTWTVPPTIFRKDKLPEIRKDTDYLARNRLRVIDHSGRELSPEQVNWSNPQGIMLRQDAGPGNALGQVAIRFPNPYSVYLHDTPNQHLFERDQRTFSSGCVRVEKALTLVDMLVADDEAIDREQVQRLLDSGRTRNVSLNRPVPILLAYWTVSVDADGQPRYLKDIYQRDEAILSALKARDRPVLPLLRCQQQGTDKRY